MSAAGRIAVTVVSALLIGAYAYASAFEHDRDGALWAIVHGPVFGWIPVVLMIGTTALVFRWWALSVALAPLAALYYLHEATDYVYPFHEDPYPAVVIFGTFVYIGIACIGFVLRVAIDWAIRNLPASSRRA